MINRFIEPNFQMHNTGRKRREILTSRQLMIGMLIWAFTMVKMGIKMPKISYEFVKNKGACYLVTNQLLFVFSKLGRWGKADPLI